MSFFWKILARRAMFALDAEKAHEIGIRSLESGLASPFYASGDRYKSLSTIKFGLNFSNPMGVAAGFDKNARVFGKLIKLGFGFVETGTVTFRPQPGNPKPRMFRLKDDNALINRLGFNNEGAAAVVEHLKYRKTTAPIGVNIGKNKDVPNEEAVENYLDCFELVHPVADYITVNISSPNTPNLRELQKAESLDELLDALQKRNAELGKKPLLVKIAPDLSGEEIDTAVDISMDRGLDGMIAVNTTISRDGLNSAARNEIGGLSGRPLTKHANEVISRVYRRSAGSLPIIGVGGIMNAQDAYDKIAAGASLLQAYTGFVYGGPTFAADTLTGLDNILRSRGFSSIDQAVGSTTIV